MKPLRAFLRRFRGLLQPAGQRDGDLTAELESHLQMHIDDNLRAGLSPEEARRRALLKLGGLEAAKQMYREQSTLPLLEHVLQDARFALRQLRRNPGFTVTAVLMLALGIAASVSIFAFVDAALIKPLPYREPDRLVGVYESIPLFPQDNLSYPDFLDWKRMNRTLSALDAYQHMGMMLTTAAGAEAARATRVTDGFFRTLGVSPILGRDFHPGEDQLSAPRTVLLSYAAWQKRYGGRRDVLGATVILDGFPNTVIGVLPADFHFAPAEPADFWTAMHPQGGCDLRRSCHSVYAIGRLQDGTSLRAALASFQSIAAQLATEYPGSNHGQGASLLPLTEVIGGNMRPLFLTLLSGAALLLLIACVNVTSLLLVRAEGRRRELAVRSAIGASSLRLFTQFATEGMVLVALGTALGLASAWWSIALLTRLIPEDMLFHMPYLQGLSLNSRVVAFAFLLGCCAALLFSLIPALHLSLSGMREGLAEGSRGSAGTAWRRLGSKLVVVELSTAVVLLSGAGLLGKSVYHLLQVELGFSPERVTTVEVAVPRAHYAKDEQVVGLAREIVRRTGSLPGVTSAALTTMLPLSGNGNTDWIRFPGRPFHGEHNEINERDVSADYFATFGARLLRGRYFTDAEDSSKPRVAIINQAFARMYFPGQDPIGQRFGSLDLAPNSVRQIVGVVDNIREGVLSDQIWPAEYLPFNQNPDTYFVLAFRSAGDGQTLLPSLTASLRKLDRGIVTLNGLSMRQRMADSREMYLHRSSAWLAGGFAAFALLLGVIGLYGVIAYSVSQRTREIGVRMALGAQHASVYRLIFREASSLAGLGIAIGLACSVLAAYLIRALLFGVTSWDVPTLAAVAALLAVFCLLASFLPARRAASVNPMEALRSE